MKKAIFTVLFGEYDELRNAPSYKGWDSILFTDKPPKNAKGWQVRIVKLELSTEKESRRYKLLSHLYLSEYSLVCYMDANMDLRQEPPSRPIWFTHPRRNYVFEEARQIIRLKKADSGQVDRQMKAYLDAKFKDRFGLYQNGFFVRAHNEKMNKLMQVTFATVEKFTHRDQLALPYAVFVCGYKPEGLKSGVMSGRFFTLHSHAKKGTIAKDKVSVHHITPARADKNLGKAINQIIEGLPDNDWICLRDIDTVPPYHEAFISQVEELVNNNQGYELLGCMTNRLGLKWQLVDGMFDEWDMKKHREVAKELAKKNTIKPLHRGQTVGGLFMLFSKQTWKKYGKFPEGGIKIKGSFVDYHFSLAVRGKKGIAEGIYLFHNYRPDAKDTRRATNHLI